MHSFPWSGVIECISQMRVLGGSLSATWARIPLLHLLAVTHKVAGISWVIDDKSYPLTIFKFEFDNTENKTIVPFNNYINICMKRYGVSLPILGKIDFQNLYNIYGINLSS